MSNININKQGQLNTSLIIENGQYDNIAKIGKTFSKNILPTIYSVTYTPVTAAWDTTKHEGAINVPNWTNGYNGGVSNPSIGYHAMWKLIDGIPTIIFQNHNSEISQQNRWIGVSSSAINATFTAGLQYTLSYDQMTIDTLNSYTTGGRYYKQSSSGSNGFHDGCPQIGKNTVLNKWERFSKTFTVVSTVTETATPGTIYLYGYYSPESTIYIRNIKLELNSFATPYIDGFFTNNYTDWTNATIFYEY